MLQFNLSQPDRATLHKSISASLISPKLLSTMTSTELANEEQQEEIKQAEKEALEHSILQKLEAPRAKLTHKGLQDIEDMSGITVTQREEEREKEEEARRERERMARARAAEANRQRSLSINAGPLSAGVPESPITPATPATPYPGWGASTDLSTDAMQTSFSHDGGPLVVPDDSVLPEPDIDLSDFINIDDEPTLAEMNPIQSPLTNEAMFSPITPVVGSAIPPSLSTSSTGPSPFSTSGSKLGIPQDKADVDDMDMSETPPSEHAGPVPEPSQEHHHEDNMQVDIDLDAENVGDQDFDLILQDDFVDNTPAGQQQRFDELPLVWSGAVSEQTAPRAHNATNFHLG